MNTLPNSTAPDSRVLDLVREDLRDFGGYKSARSEALRGDIWLNANESAWANPADTQASCRRYPDPQPQALRDRLAQLSSSQTNSIESGLARRLGLGGAEAVTLSIVRGLHQQLLEHRVHAGVVLRDPEPTLVVGGATPRRHAVLAGREAADDQQPGRPVGQARQAREAEELVARLVELPRFDETLYFAIRLVHVRAVGEPAAFRRLVEFGEVEPQ